MPFTYPYTPRTSMRLVEIFRFSSREWKRKKKRGVTRRNKFESFSRAILHATGTTVDQVGMIEIWLEFNLFPNNQRNIADTAYPVFVRMKRFCVFDWARNSTLLGFRASGSKKRRGGRRLTEYSKRILPRSDGNVSHGRSSEGTISPRLIKIQRMNSFSISSHRINLITIRRRCTRCLSG